MKTLEIETDLVVLNDFFVCFISKTTISDGQVLT